MQNGSFLKTKRRRYNDEGGKKLSSLVFVLVQRLVKHIFSLCASLGIGVVQAFIIFKGHWTLAFLWELSSRSKFKTGGFSRMRPLSRRPHVLNIYLREFHILAWSMKDPRAGLAIELLTCVSFNSSRVSLAWFRKDPCATSCNRTTSIIVL